MRLRAGVAALAAATLAMAMASCGGGGAAPSTSTTATGATSPRPAPVVTRLGPGLSLGLTEANADLLQAPGTQPAGTAIDPAFAPWRRRLTDLAPALYRLAVDWSSLQPDPGTPAQLDRDVDGCSRGIPPCGAYAGLKATFAALASQQRRGGFAALVTFYGVPAWAAAPPSGCERDATEARSRPISAIGLRAYGELVTQVSALARRQGATISWWSPWNEPNGAFFISPQRARCSSSAPPVSTAVYTRLARAMRTALAGDRGSRAMVVGELAGVAGAGPRGTGSGDFLAALPDDVVCGAVAISQHSYAHLPGQQRRGGDPVAATEAAMATRPCLRDTPLWITETGTGGVHAGEARDLTPASLRAQCRAYAGELAGWLADPRIQAAFQYSFREDTAFPVGLADAGLARTYPTYDLLLAWARRPAPDAPPPPLPASCRG